MNHWWTVSISVLIGSAVIWLALLGTLWAARPGDLALRDALRLLPDVLRLIHRLARDPLMPRGVRIRLWLLMAYLAMPIDLVPDFIPVLGYADDAIVMIFALRSLARRAGPAALEQHWPGTPEGLAAVRRLAGLE